MRRLVLTFLVLAGGLALSAVSYFLLAAPLGHPGSEDFSNPRVPFAAGLFIIGLLTLFISAIVYELLPERGDG